MVTAFKQTGGHPEQCFTNHYCVTAVYQKRGAIVLVENKVFRENCTRSDSPKVWVLFGFVQSYTVIGEDAEVEECLPELPAMHNLPTLPGL